MTTLATTIGAACRPTASAASRRMHSRKAHRYVSATGPQPAKQDPSIARALDAAENEGWPMAGLGLGGNAAEAHDAIAPAQGAWPANDAPEA